MKRNFFHKVGDWISGTSGLPSYQNPPTPSPLNVSNRIEPKQVVAPVGIPSRRVSEPSWGYDSVVQTISKELSVINHDFLVEIIPVIRKLSRAHPVVSQALNNIVTLGNTGHKIFFDRNVPDDQVDKMRNHLINRARLWAPGQPNMDGVVNKMFSQIMIGGALSTEWVPTDDLSGIESVIFVNPEEVRFVLSKDKKRYKPYQQAVNLIRRAPNVANLIPLNENTFRYFALNGDTEIPYGYPPYMSVLDRVVSQNKMHCNIDFIVDIVGLVGFIEFLMDKPDKNGGESEEVFGARLTKLLEDAKSNIKAGLKDGVVAGFIGDHEFKFNSASGKDIAGLQELYKINEMQMLSGLFTDPTIAGRDYNTSETQITVIFMKLLSQLRNTQNLVKANLEFGYALDLRLAGFKFDYLTVQFRKSTIQDDYKFQQAEEIKVRNVERKYILGVINQNQMADELDYEAPDQAQPRVPLENLLGTKSPDQEAKDGEKRQGQKNKSAKKVRKDNKPTGGKDK